MHFSPLCRDEAPRVPVLPGELVPSEEVAFARVCVCGCVRVCVCVCVCGGFICWCFTYQLSVCLPLHSKLLAGVWAQRLNLGRRSTAAGWPRYFSGARSV